MLTRRFFVGAGSLAALSGLAACSSTNTARLDASPVASSYTVMPAFYGPMPGERFPIPAVPEGVVPADYWRRRVPDPTGETPGTIVVDPSNYYLYLVEGGGTAMRYGVGVGREGFGWSGDAIIKVKKEWPVWVPPKEMIARDPALEPYSLENGGHPPGLGNPLGARALYLFDGGRDTFYRIHGTNEPRSIGNSVSSGCIRLLNQDIIDLYNRVPTGTRVVVLPAGRGMV
ncbi:MAG: L,D-transpeptidase [Flavobacteriaceae bacterium]